MEAIIRFKIFLVILFLFNTSYCQEVRAFLQVDSSKILIGEQVRAILKVEVDSAAEVKFPVINKYINEQVEVIEISDIETQAINKYKILSQALTLTAFDSGNPFIPPFNFIIKNKDESLDTISTNTAFISVSLPAVDTTTAFKDIKEPIDTPFQSNEIWSYLNYFLYAIIIIVVGLIGYQYYKINKPKPKPVVVALPRPEEPGAIALRELEALNKNKKWENEEGVKDFYEEISLILRKYINGRFNMITLERTSNEILKDLGKRALEKYLHLALNQVLILSDFVKFAKYKTSKEENNKSLENAFLFVNKTKGTQINKGINA